MWEDGEEYENEHWAPKNPLLKIRLIDELLVCEYSCEFLFQFRSAFLFKLPRRMFDCKFDVLHEGW